MSSDRRPEAPAPMVRSGGSRVRPWLLGTGAVLAGLVLLLELAWLVAVPSGPDLAALASRTVRQAAGVAIRLDGARKTILPGIAADAVQLTVSDRTVTPLTRLRVRLQPLRLLGGVPVFVFRGVCYEGILKGSAGVARASGPFLDFRIDGTDVAPLLALAGLTGEGKLQAEGGLRGQEGEIRLQVPELRLEASGLLAFLPVDRFRSMDGLIRIENEKLTVPGIEVRGEGMHARLEGTITRTGSLRLSLELYPDADFIKTNSLLLAGLNRYRKTPGHYSVPVRGTLWNPRVG